MTGISEKNHLLSQFIHGASHDKNDYFGLIKALLEKRDQHGAASRAYNEWQGEIDRVYSLIQAELLENRGKPVTPVQFGTSGWRGILGKDLFCKSVAQVTLAIIRMYTEKPQSPELAKALGGFSPEEARNRGCIIGHDNRFGGEILANTAIDILTSNGFQVYNAGEATTGTISAALLRVGAAFSINLTPSHNPLEYGGYKFNAHDGGPASSIITDLISSLAHSIIQQDQPLQSKPLPNRVQPVDALAKWIELVTENVDLHGLDYDHIISRFNDDEDMVVAIDCVHGASRVHMRPFFKDTDSGRLLLFRDNADPTFGGIAPEPSGVNMQRVKEALSKRAEHLKVGAILDPDADRIRFTDGEREITMNHFGAMAYHYLHEIKRKKGMVAKTVATSNFANALAQGFGEDIFEPRVGFKEFKPVIGKALVIFEESDGISVIGHTPEKDAYMGLLLALDMTLTLRQCLGEYLKKIEEEFGAYYPARDGVTVSKQGAELKESLSKLKKYCPGSMVSIGDGTKKIQRVIEIDGYKMIFKDESWIMIRPSGTEPKVRFYVEGRNPKETESLFSTAKGMLQEIGLLS